MPTRKSDAVIDDSADVLESSELVAKGSGSRWKDLDGDPEIQAGGFYFNIPRLWDLEDFLEKRWHAGHVPLQGEPVRKELDAECCCGLPSCRECQRVTQSDCSTLYQRAATLTEVSVFVRWRLQRTTKPKPESFSKRGVSTNIG